MKFDLVAAEPAWAESVDTFLDTQATAHPFQFHGWAGTHLRDRSQMFWLGKEDGTIRLSARCVRFGLLGRKIPGLAALSIPRGPVCDDAGLAESALHWLIDESRRRNLVYVEISPEWSSPEHRQLAIRLLQGGWEAYAGERASLRVDLSPEPESILSTFRKTTRYEIRKAERDGILIEEGSDSGFAEDFLRLHRELEQRKKLSPEPEDHMRHVVSWMGQGKDRGSVIRASFRGEVLGTVVVVRAGKRCWYVWGASSPGRQVNVGHILQWRAMLWARARGCTEYDLGGYTEGSESGPALFKHGFSDQVVRFVPAMRYVLRHRVYAMAQKLLGSALREKRLPREN